jgi:hypothetical protein
MPTFTDTQQRNWEIHITPPDVMRIRREVDPGFLIEDGTQQHTYLRMCGDPALLIFVLFALAQKQREERGISDDDFFSAAVGDALTSGLNAIAEAMMAFVGPTERDRLAKIIATKKQLDDAILARIDSITADGKLGKAIIDLVDQSVDHEVDTLLEKLGRTADVE